jgi:hypothetical protein
LAVQAACKGPPQKFICAVRGGLGLGRPAASREMLSASSFLPQRGVPLDQFTAQTAREGGANQPRAIR